MKHHPLSASYKISSGGNTSEGMKGPSEIPLPKINIQTIEVPSNDNILNPNIQPQIIPLGNPSPSPRTIPPPIPQLTKSPDGSFPPSRRPQPPPPLRGNDRGWSLSTTGQAVGPSGINTHYFDGKFTSFLSMIEPETSVKILREIKRAAEVEKEGKHKIFLELESKILSLPSDTVSKNTKCCLRTIIHTHEMLGRGNGPSNPNYSESDKLSACDLLFLLSEKIILEGNEEYLNLLISQLDEMASGLCPQGRVNRLFQTYVMLRDDLTETSKIV